jgi:hypothetical protein
MINSIYVCMLGSSYTVVVLTHTRDLYMFQDVSSEGWMCQLTVITEKEVNEMKVLKERTARIYVTIWVQIM